LRSNYDIILLFSRKGHWADIFAEEENESLDARAETLDLQRKLHLPSVHDATTCVTKCQSTQVNTRSVHASTGRVIRVYARAIKSPRLFPLQHFAACCFGNVTSALRVARANFRETLSIVTEQALYYDAIGLEWSLLLFMRNLFSLGISFDTPLNGLSDLNRSFSTGNTAL